MSRSNRSIRLVASGLLMTMAAGAAVAGHAGPALADNRTKSADLARRRHDLQIRINLAIASDDAVKAEDDRLARAVVAEAAALARARSALASASGRVTDSQHRLDSIDAQSGAAKRALVARAVDLYKHPFRSEAALLTGASDLNQYAERQALVGVIQGRTSDLIDAFRQQQVDEFTANQALFAARVDAQRKQAALQDQEDRLTQAHAAADKAHNALQQRIADLQLENRGLAEQEASLQATLSSNQAAVAAANAKAGGTGPGGAGGFVKSAPGHLAWPLHGPVTREFGYQPGGFHPGIDIAPGYGTPIHAAGDGSVIYAGWESGYGNYTCIDHGGGISSCYGHQSAINVSVGQVVRQGQVIGAEGSTGNSTGPHVHFEIRVNGAVNNPRNFIGGSP